MCCAATTPVSTPAERALADWARKVAGDANATTVEDVQALRDAGFSDQQVFAITVYVAARMAFSTVNDALGATPDVELVPRCPPPCARPFRTGGPLER